MNPLSEQAMLLLIRLHQEEFKLFLNKYLPIVCEAQGIKMSVRETRPKERWTQRQIKSLAQLYEKHKKGEDRLPDGSLEAFAQELGKTKEQVKAKAYQMGLSKRG